MPRNAYICLSNQRHAGVLLPEVARVAQKMQGHGDWILVELEKLADYVDYRFAHRLHRLLDRQPLIRNTRSPAGNADVGLLYNPSRQGEVDLCAHWKAALATRAPELRVRRNYPYAGKGDGLTSHLRNTFPHNAYIGIELEVNQRIVFDAGRRWPALRRVLFESLRTACAANQMPRRPTTNGDE